MYILHYITLAFVFFSQLDKLAKTPSCQNKTRDMTERTWWIDDSFKEDCHDPGLRSDSQLIISVWTTKRRQQLSTSWREAGVKRNSIVHINIILHAHSFIV